MTSKLTTLGVVLTLSVLIVTGCGAGAAQTEEPPTIAPTERPTDIPMTNPTEVPAEVPDPTRARDAALVHIIAQYGDQPPASGLIWTEEVITPEGLVGSSSFQYVAGDWVVTVSFPLVAPQATVYQVAVINQVTGFQWEGEVDAAGQVTELSFSAGSADV
jgi:hypothetical protein